MVPAESGNGIVKQVHGFPGVAALAVLLALSLLVACGGSVATDEPPGTLPPTVTKAAPLTSASWLNLVERWFRELTEKRARLGSFESVPQLITAIE